MPRRQFVADLQQAQAGLLPPGIFDLEPGEDDGQFQFNHASGGDSVTAVKVTAIVLEVSDYPKSHEYMIFSGEEAPRHITTALEDLRRTKGKTVFELLDIISTSLSIACGNNDDEDTPMPDSQLDDDNQSDEEEEDDDDIYDRDHEAFQVSSATPQYNKPSITKPKVIDRAFRKRIRTDLIVAKQAGFKVGILGPILEGSNAFVTLSIRVAKLGISEEAMEAWHVSSADYLTLIIQYPNGYKTNEELQDCESHRLQANIGMRVCAGKKYKPTLQEAIKAFSVAKTNGPTFFSSDLPKAEDTELESSIKETFISRPLNGLLQGHLVTLLRFRSAGMTWAGAEEHYDNQNSAASSDGGVPVSERCFEPEEVNPAFPDIVNADHQTESRQIDRSFPLLAMQFVLRHFVRCTEFCLVCHRKMNTELEAIKPYVCDRELCLYQYMTLGFGPSVEHEILTQPYVVDLLVSFCYNSAATRKLKEYPDGLSLVVPPITADTHVIHTPVYNHRGTNGAQASAGSVSEHSNEVYEVGFDREQLKIIFHKVPAACPVKRGEWIVLKTTGTLSEAEVHCRVADATYFPTIDIDEPVVVSRLFGAELGVAVQSHTTAKQLRETPASPATTPLWLPATITKYCEDFKGLPVEQKCISICRLLDTLPTVKTMQEYLVKHNSVDLKHWVKRISPAALGLLRWIIASNRACIMQVDGDDGGASSTAKQERLFGMNGYMQFRFAMGAPDKEQRFVTEVRKTKTRLKLTHPTIFAWHGSPLHNWHMIIREGLHFKNADHGRAYGHGVYHATDASTSTGYSNMAGGSGVGTWQGSVLRITTAIALNEIVNAPAEFTSSSPYYVVAQLDWIQTRYLFVQCSPVTGELRFETDTAPKAALVQDPQRIPKGASGGRIVIPASAIKTNKYATDGEKLRSPNVPGPLKKLKAALGTARENPIQINGSDDDVASVQTNDSDNEVMYGVDPEPVVEKPKKVVVAKAPVSPTDFVAGSLNWAKLPLMPLPTYATSNTTKRLMRDLQECKKTQDVTPAGELGWFIDVEKVENAYQWIVEMHSFNNIEIGGKRIPLANDMEKHKVKSVVMEIRFNHDFPFTPPYIRVIRPRFLSLAQGGGGHIVLGGAMCMELLTNTGWSSVSTMESVLLQTRLAIASEPFARLDPSGIGRDYGTAEAADGYIRACQAHGWQVPPGFKEMAYGIPELQ